jgi:ribosomal-protein-alanine N-acetyltransferase
MNVTLQSISRADLQVLVDAGLPDSVAGRTVDGALPPPFVAKRALDQLQSGKDEYWCSTFYIVRDADGFVVGSCGFKDIPVAGRVEIGYGMAPDCQNQGVATQAVRELLRLAFVTEEVSEVLAQINPTNGSSTRVVQKLGFVKGELKADESGELLVQWVLRKHSAMEIATIPRRQRTT